ncbi:MAG: glycoside hydrolase family 15 protein [Dermatophilaceae bacterium]
MTTTTTSPPTSVPASGGRPVAAAVRALTTTQRPALTGVDLVVGDVDLQRIAQHMYALMLRNVATDGYPFSDSSHTLESLPGCVIAAPSYPANAPGISQDYVFNWVRDAAITALELTAATPPDPDNPVQALVDYVTFADLCQRTAAPTKGHACFTIAGQPRPWSEQNDGPAIQTVALLAGFGKLDTQTQQVARDLIGRNVAFLLGCYQEQTTNLWEEHIGFSFFARSVQLRCLRELAANTVGIAVPDGVQDAIAWLQNALQVHWNGTYYATMIGGPAPGDPNQPTVPKGYDPNIDIVQAAIYGAVPCTDTRLLSTAAQLRSVWADPTSSEYYPVNGQDAKLGYGPMFGRYPGDLYSGGSDSLGDHPWALCTANVAELYYRLATAIEASGQVPLDGLSQPFFGQVGVTSATTAPAAVTLLRTAGDELLKAVVYHSDHLELSEQFDGFSGYEKSVRDLTWSYAAFLSAVRARNGSAVNG